MANTINNNFFNYSDSMFSSLGANKSGSSSNLLGDYAAIKNGSYKKLLNAYYDKQEAEENGTAGNNEEVDKRVTLMAQDAKELKSATDALRTTGKNSLFKPKTVTTTDEAGVVTETQEYDYDAIYDAAEKFIEAFNSMLDSAASVSNKTTTKKMALTDNMLRKNAGLLEDIGITVESSGKLTVDKDKFMKADINDLKTVFNGSGSIADRLSKRAGDIYATAEKILSVSGETYNRSGGLNTNVKTGTIVDEEL